MERTSVNTRALPVFLALACLVPTVFGGYRVAALIWQWDWALQFSKVHVDNLPLALHAFFAVTFLLLGAFQLLPGFRNANFVRHRLIGRLTVVMGLLGAASGIVMTLIHTDISGPLLYAGRILFGAMWATFLVLAVRAIMARNIPAHRAWMMRSYAVALNAGTLAFIYLPIMLVFGEPSPLIDEIIQVAGWIVNLSVAQWFIRRGTKRRAKLLPGPARNPQPRAPA